MMSLPIPLDRRDLLVAFGLATLVLLGGSMRMAPGVCGVYHDDAIYVSTAQSLAEGEGYRLTGVPGAPLQTKYPILYPAALAFVWSLWPDFPDNLVAMQILTLASGAGVVALSYLYLVRFGYSSRGIAAAGGVLCATSPFFLYFCVQTMAEMPYAMMTIAALWATDNYLTRAGASRRAEFRFGMLVALPFVCRTIGVVLVASSIAVLWRSRRRVVWCVAGAAAVALPWVCFSLLGRGIWDRNPIDGYYTDYMGCWSSTGIEMLGRVFRWNAVLVAFGTGRLTCEGLSTAVEPLVALGPRLLVLMAVGLIPWLTMVRPLWQGRPLPWTMAVYLLLILVWSWPPRRFLVPILPFLTVYLCAGLAVMLKRLPPGLCRRLAISTGLGVLVVTNLGLLSHHADVTARTGYPLMRAADTPVAWSSFERTLRWLRAHSKPDDVIVSGLDSMVSLYTGRQSFRPFTYNPGLLFYGEGPQQLMTVEELAAILKHRRPRYLMHTPMPGFAEDELFAEVVDELRRRHPGWLDVAYEDVDPRFVVFELDYDEKPGGDEIASPQHGSDVDSSSDWVTVSAVR